ncbi:MAG: LacI family DNA-binding transcriptional regulator, partial [Ornithinimicrobium sp.]
MADVAVVAGDSSPTVSRALNESPLVRRQTRVRLKVAIVERGYRCNFAARGLARNRSGRLGMRTTDLAQYR